MKQFSLPFYDDAVDGDLVDDLVDAGVTRAGVGGRRLSLSPLNAIEYSELPTSK